MIGGRQDNNPRRQRPAGRYTRPPARGQGRPPSRGAQRPRPQKPTEPKESRDDVIDLYDDVPKDAPDKYAEEVEELKKLAQSDVLKAYAWTRKQFGRLGQFMRGLKAQVTPKRLKYAKIGAISAAVLVLGFAFLPDIYRGLAGEGDTLGDIQIAPDFDTLESSSQDKQSIVFDPEAGVAVYQDSLDGVQLTVTQQPFPENFEGNPAGLESLAFSLTDTTSLSQLQTDKGTAYVALNANDTNTTLFTYQELLINIRSSGLIDNEVWIDYINSLE